MSTGSDRSARANATASAERASRLVRMPPDVSSGSIPSALTPPDCRRRDRRCAGIGYSSSAAGNTISLGSSSAKTPLP